jgi:hypothetical protein
MRLDHVQTAQAMVANARWAERLGWRDYAPAIAVLLQTNVSDPGAAPLAEAIAGFQTDTGLAVDGVLGPKTWAVLARRLAPAQTVTGVRPPDVPGVPVGFDQVLAAFGDPRPLLAADGSITDENREAWERRTLARGTLAFPIPVDPDNPGAGTKTAFYAHHLLVPVFESVFAEIERLELQGLVRSWDGIYNFRPIRGTTAHISLHAFGAAIDLNANSNQLGTAGDMDPRIVEVFEHFGFFWGGRFLHRPDPMHFQYATGY